MYYNLYQIMNKIATKILLLLDQGHNKNIIFIQEHEKFDVHLLKSMAYKAEKKCCLNIWDK